MCVKMEVSAGRQDALATSVVRIYGTLVDVDRWCYFLGLRPYRSRDWGSSSFPIEVRFLVWDRMIRWTPPSNDKEFLPLLWTSAIQYDVLIPSFSVIAMLHESSSNANLKLTLAQFKTNASIMNI
jgi:hypothetical protein